MVAASIRADTTDLRTFLDVLAVKLADALPGHVTVERESGLFRKDPRVRELRVSLEDALYELRWVGGGLEARVAQRGGGLPLPAEPISLDLWLDRLWRHLRQYAKTSSQGRSALGQILSGEAPAETISRPPAGRGSLLSRHPDEEIPPGSQLVVATGEQAVFVRDGSVLGSLPPGTWVLDASSQPFLAPLLDPQAGVFRVSLFFVSVGELPNLPFGGTVDNVADPETGLAIGLRVFGDYSLQVVDPGAFVLGLAGGQQTAGNEQVTDWMREQLLKVLRTHVVAHIGRQGWSILGLAAHTAEIESETLDRVREAVAGHGLRVVAIANFTISMKDEDEANLKRYRTELQYRKLASSSSPPPAPAAVPGGEQACSGCGVTNPASARFCASCGRPLSVACPSCGTSNPASARFCASCGTQIRPGAPATRGE